MMDSLASQAITDAPDRGEMSFRRELEIIQEEVEEELWHEEEQEKKEILGSCESMSSLHSFRRRYDKHDLLGTMDMHAPWWKDLSCESMSSLHFFWRAYFWSFDLDDNYIMSQPRRNETGGNASKVLDDGSMDDFSFLAKRRELTACTTDARQSPKQLWLEYCQAETPGESKTLLSKPLYDKRSEAENFINYSSKPAEHCTSAEKHNAIIPDNDRLLCKVCYMNELSIVFLPCSHMVTCRRCAARLKLCPVCRSGIKEALPANLHE